MSNRSCPYSTNLTISLFGYKNHYRPSAWSWSAFPAENSVKMGEDRQDMDDWPTHCAFFDKDADFDISPFLKSESQISESLENSIALLATRNAPLYKKFLDIIAESESSPLPEAEGTSDVFIDMDLYSSSDEEDALLMPTRSDIQEQGQGSPKRHMNRRQKVEKLDEGGAAQTAGDWTSSIKTHGYIANGDVCIEMLPSPYPTEVVHRSQVSVLSSIRKQLRTIFTKNVKRPFEREIYV